MLLFNCAQIVELLYIDRRSKISNYIQHMYKFITIQVLEEETKADVVRRLPLYSCRKHTGPMGQDNKDESSVKRPLFSRKEIVHLKFILAYIRGDPLKI